MAAKTKPLVIEVGAGLVAWAHDGRTFEAGTHEIARPSKKLRQAAKDAEAAGVGVRVLKG